MLLRLIIAATVKPLLICLFTLALSPCFAQSTFYSTDSWQLCTLDSSTSKFDKCTTEYHYCTFKLNAEKTTLQQTTSTKQTVFDLEANDSFPGLNLLSYTATDDADTEYDIVIDAEHSEIAVSCEDDVHGEYTFKYHIKSSWQGDDK